MYEDKERSHLVEVMCDAFVEAPRGRDRHGIIHVHDIALVPDYLKISLRTGQDSHGLSRARHGL